MGFQPQLFSDERLDEQLDPLPFVVVNNNPRKVRRIRVSCQSLSRQPAVSKSLQLQLHFSDTNRIVLASREVPATICSFAPNAANRLYVFAPRGDRLRKTFCR